MKTNKHVDKQNAQALIINDEINRLRRRYDKLTDEICQLTKELNQVCIHDETEVKYDFIDGSYYDRKQYITKTVCKICGKELDIKVKYGGYG